jgi:hypothetical protein
MSSAISVHIPVEELLDVVGELVPAVTDLGRLALEVFVASRGRLRGLTRPALLLALALATDNLCLLLDSGGDVA